MAAALGYKQRRTGFALTALSAGQRETAACRSERQPEQSRPAGQDFRSFVGAEVRVSVMRAGLSAHEDRALRLDVRVRNTTRSRDARPAPGGRRAAVGNSTLARRSTGEFGAGR
jgi:hypothetical protein